MTKKIKPTLTKVQMLNQLETMSQSKKRHPLKAMSQSKKRKKWHPLKTPMKMRHPLKTPMDQLKTENHSKKTIPLEMKNQQKKKLIPQIIAPQWTSPFKEIHEVARYSFHLILVPPRTTSLLSLSLKLTAQHEPPLFQPNHVEVKRSTIRLKETKPNTTSEKMEALPEDQETFPYDHGSS